MTSPGGLVLRMHADPLPRWTLPHHRPTKDVLLFRAEEQVARDHLLPRRHTPRLLQVADRWGVGRDVRLSQSVRVRCCNFPLRMRVSPSATQIVFVFSRDFFPVILTFLRQLPFIGQFLNLPYVRRVRLASPPRACSLTPPRAPVPGPLCRLAYLCSMTTITPIYWRSTLPN